MSDGCDSVMKVCNTKWEWRTSGGGGGGGGAVNFYCAYLQNEHGWVCYLCARCFIFLSLFQP